MKVISVESIIVPNARVENIRYEIINSVNKRYAVLDNTVVTIEGEKKSPDLQDIIYYLRSNRKVIGMIETEADNYKLISIIFGTLQ